MRHVTGNAYAKSMPALLSKYPYMLVYLCICAPSRFTKEKTFVPHIHFECDFEPSIEVQNGKKAGINMRKMNNLRTLVVSTKYTTS